MEEKLHTRVLNTLLWNCGSGVFSFHVIRGAVVIREKCTFGSQDWLTVFSGLSRCNSCRISVGSSSAVHFCWWWFLVRFLRIIRWSRDPPPTHLLCPESTHGEKTDRRMRSGEKGFSEAERTPAARAQHSPLMTSEDAVFPRIAGETRFSPRRGRWRAPKSYEWIMIVWVFRWKARGEEGDRFLYTPTLMWDERTLKFI